MRVLLVIRVLLEGESYWRIYGNWRNLFYIFIHLQAIDLIVVEFEVEFSYTAPKEPPIALVDDTLKAWKNKAGFTAVLPSSGKN